MDFSTVKINLESIPMQLEHPSTGAPMDGLGDPVLYILPPQHEKVLATERKFRNKLLKNARRTLGTAEDLDAQTLEILVACVDAWENVTLEGEKLECTPSNVRKLLGDPELAWLRDQVQAFVNDVQNFIRKA